MRQTITLFAKTHFSSTQWCQLLLGKKISHDGVSVSVADFVLSLEDIDRFHMLERPGLFDDIDSGRLVFRSSRQSKESKRRGLLPWAQLPSFKPP